MVPPIERQMQYRLIEKEEERCRKLEAKYDKNEETRGKTVRRKAIEKPWTRFGKHALCQNTDMLILVDEYDYDLSDGAFRDYCEARGVLHVAGKAGSRRWVFFLEYGRSKREYLQDPYFQHAQEADGKRYRFTDAEMETGWRVILLGRATLQDCWELYAGDRDSQRST